MKFGEECLKGVPNGIVPFLKVRCRDDLNFTGHHIPYKDYTKFLMYEDVIMPLFVVSEIPENAIIFDASNFLSIGAIEVLGTFFGHDAEEDELLRFEKDLLNASLLSWKDINRLKCDFDDYLTGSAERVNDSELSLILSMRTPYLDDRRPTINRVINRMLLAHLTNDSVFCEALINTFPVALGNMGGYIRGSIQLLSINGGSNMNALSGKALSYKVPGSNKQRYITDCRGLGIYSYLLLLVCTYAKFADFRGMEYVKPNLERLIPAIQKWIIGCLGDDVVGTYCKTGIINCGLCGAKDYSLDCATYYRPPYNVKTRYEVDGKKIPREIYENTVLYRKANCVALKDTQGAHRDLSIVYCADFQSLYDGLIALTNLDESMPIPEDKNLDRECALMSEIESKDKIIEILRTKNDELLKQIDEIKFSYESSEKIEVAHLTNQLEVKNDIISNLREEIESLECELRNHYSEEDLDDTLIPELDESVSLQEMIDFLNEYKLVMVGGRIDLIPKLQQLGLTNIIQIDSTQVVNNTPTSGDFYCFNTKFIAHKLVKAIQSIYADSTSQMYYFNGTNPEFLVRVSYEFIKSWLNS